MLPTSIKAKIKTAFMEHCLNSGKYYNRTEIAELIAEWTIQNKFPELTEYVQQGDSEEEQKLFGQDMAKLVSELCLDPNRPAPIIKSFADLISKVSKVFYYIGKNNAVELRRITVDGKEQIKVNKYKERIPEKYQEEFMKEVNEHKVFNIICMANAIGKGPKILDVDALDFELLELTDLTLSLDEYNQPFETIIIELPDSYRNKRNITYQGIGLHPLFVILNFDKKEKILIVTAVGDKDGFSPSIIIVTNADQTIEEAIVQRERKHEDATISDFWSILRACINTCLLVDEYGAKKIGPRNSSHYDRLKGYCEKARKSKDQQRIENAEHDLRTYPIHYGFTQDIVLATKVVMAGEAGEPSGKIMKPHRRRGHYRNQPHGPGLSLRKRIRIPPCFINPHLFVGDEADIITRYRIK